MAIIISFNEQYGGFLLIRLSIHVYKGCQWSFLHWRLGGVFFFAAVHFSTKHYFYGAHFAGNFGTASMSFSSTTSLTILLSCFRVLQEFRSAMLPIKSVPCSVLTELEIRLWTFRSSQRWECSDRALEDPFLPLVSQLCRGRQLKNFRKREKVSV